MMENMKDIFFLRFNLQRSCASFGENQFDTKEILSMSDEQISGFLKKCEEEQFEVAMELKAEFNETLSVLYGKKILFIGDSITQDIRGYRGIITKAAQLEAESIAFSGATSTDMLRRAYDGINKSFPDIVSLMIGTNDVYFVDKERKVNLVSMDEYARNVKSILENASSIGAKLIVGTIPPMDEEKAQQHKSNVTKFNTNSNIRCYNAVLNDEIKRAGAYCIDTYTSILNTPSYFEPDGVHISPCGHKLLAKKWIEAILKVM